MLWLAPPATLGLTLLGKLELSYIKIIEQTSWLKKVTPLTGSLFDLFDFDWFWSWGPWLQSAIHVLGIIMLIIITIISLLLCMLSETLNVCLELLTTKQVSSLRLEHQKRNKGNDRLKDSRPEAVACDCHGDQTSARDVWRNSVHISQLS